MVAAGRVSDVALPPAVAGETEMFTKKIDEWVRKALVPTRLIAYISISEGRYQAMPTEIRAPDWEPILAGTEERERGIYTFDVEGVHLPVEYVLGRFSDNLVLFARGLGEDPTFENLVSLSEKQYETLARFSSSAYQ